MLTTPPFAPSTLHALQQLGIVQLADLHRIGVIAAFLLLKAAGHTVTRRVLWQLYAASKHIPVQHISEHDKAYLLQQLQQHPPVALFPAMSIMTEFMQYALHQAHLAAQLGEIPVGAVVVYQQRIIAAAHNLCVSQHDVSQHAEIRALTIAGKQLNNYRLNDCDVYITLEPCVMCAGALLQARVKRVIFGAYEAKTGAAGSVLNVFQHRQLNQHTAVQGGILADKCQAILQQFFQAKRHNEKVIAHQNLPNG